MGCGSCVEGEKLANAKKLLNSKVSVIKKRQRKEEEARDKYSTVDEEQRRELIAKVSSVRWSITGSRCGAAHPSSDTPVSLWPFVFVLVCCCICAWSPCEAVAPGSGTSVSLWPPVFVLGGQLPLRLVAFHSCTPRQWYARIAVAARVPA